MREYDRDEYAQPGEEYDDYEDEEDGYEDEEEGEEYEEVEEEDPKPTKEALEYLELRQRLKEQIRKQMKKESASPLSKSSDKKKKLPYDNFGSFFGPSQPVIAERVIQESKSLLETRHLQSVANSLQLKKKSNGSAPAGSGSKSVAYDQKPKVINEVKHKAQKLKESRDYSSLFSDDADVRAPATSVPNSEVRSSQTVTRGKLPLPNNGRHVNGSRDERKAVSMNGQMHSKLGPNKLSSASRRPDSRSLDSRKQLGSKGGNGPGRPLGPKGLPLKTPASTTERKALPASATERKALPASATERKALPASTTERKASAPGVKNSTSSVHRPPLPSKLQSSISKQHVQHRKEGREPNMTKVLPKQSAGFSRPQINKQQRPISSRPMSQEQRPKKKPVRRHPDDELDDESKDAFSILRSMTRYNPSRFSGYDDDDDSDMEANFDEILKEEKRSALIARREDEEQARLIEEEEERERQRRAKKRKMAH